MSISLLSGARALSFNFDEPVAWTLDGEYGGDHSYAEINNIEKAVTILVSNDEYVSEQGENFAFEE